MPLTPAMRPCSAISSTAARPISAPPRAEAIGVKDVAVMGISVARQQTLPRDFRHGRVCPGHPRLSCTPFLLATAKTWMPGHRRAEATPSFGRLCPGMTIVSRRGTQGKQQVNITTQFRVRGQRVSPTFSPTFAASARGRRTLKSNDVRPSRTGIADVADIVDTTVVHRASRRDAAPSRAPASPMPLADVSLDAWRNLAGRAVEPNGYYLPDWE